jgi:hypothetical protein
MFGNISPEVLDELHANNSKEEDIEDELDDLVEDKELSVITEESKSNLAASVGGYSRHQSNPASREVSSKKGLQTKMDKKDEPHAYSFREYLNKSAPPKADENDTNLRYS